MAEETYRNPLFGRRVDRYIPPELRQGIGALLAGADMLNPVSAYREYLKDVREGDVVGGVTNAAGFVAPGVASAVASRLARPAMSAVAPYGEDAARVLMEVLSPTGAPDIQAAGRNASRGMSRREFLAGLGAAAATPALPVDEMLEGLGRAGARGGAGLSGRLGALSGLRGKMGELDEFLYEPSQLKNALSRTLDDLERAPNILADRETAMARDNLSRETRSRLDQFEESYGPMFTERAATKDMISNERGDLISDIIGDPDAFADELGDLSDDELRLLAVEINDFAGSAGIEDLIDEDMFMDNMGKFVGRLESEASRRGLRDVGVGGLREYFEEFSDAGSGSGFGSMLPDVTSRMVSGGDEFRRGLGSSGETVSSIPAREGIRAYHGSPHTFERFDMSKIGTGEGAQAYGRGLYFAEAEDVARGYRERLSYGNIKNKFLEELPADADFEEVDDLIEQNYFTPDQTQFLKELKNNDWLGFDYPSQAITAATRGSLDDYDPSPALKDAVDKLGRMYEVRIDADPEDFLDWDKPFASMDDLERFAAKFDAIDPALRKRIEDFGYVRQQMGQPLPDGNDIIREVMGGVEGKEAARAAEIMREAGIPGIRYLDAGSRGTSGGQILSVEKGPQGWVAKIRVDNRTGAFQTPTTIITTSKPFPTKQEASDWANAEVGGGTRNFVVFDDRLISIVRMYGIGGAAALLGVSALDVEQALANNLSQGELEGLLSGSQSRPD